MEEKHFPYETLREIRSSLLEFSRTVDQNNSTCFGNTRHRGELTRQCKQLRSLKVKFVIKLHSLRKKRTASIYICETKDIVVNVYQRGNKLYDTTTRLSHKMLRRARLFVSEMKFKTPHPLAHLVGPLQVHRQRDRRHRHRHRHLPPRVLRHSRYCLHQQNLLQLNLLRLDLVQHLRK